MNKVLISYFSASGKTKEVAQKIANAVSGDLFEIEPVDKYTSSDLDWTNNKSRSSIEMNNRSFRPPVKSKIDNVDAYDTILIGFPIWWDTAPTIINTFIEKNNFKGKKIYVFVTSGSSGYENSFKNLQDAYPDINFVSGKRFNGNESSDDYKSWIQTI